MGKMMADASRAGISSVYLCQTVSFVESLRSASKVIFLTLVAMSYYIQRTAENLESKEWEST